MRGISLDIRIGEEGLFVLFGTALNGGVDDPIQLHAQHAHVEIVVRVGLIQKRSHLVVLLLHRFHGELQRGNLVHLVESHRKPVYQ